jgi:hypothetical protein
MSSCKFCHWCQLRTQATGIKDTCGKVATGTAGDDDTGGKFGTSVNAAGGKVTACVSDTGRKCSPISMAPAELEVKNLSLC